jgi:hypothetical protein
MNIMRKKMLFGISVLAGILSLQACVHGTSLKTVVPHTVDVQGTYTLILYGGNYSGDLETVAILDREGDRYTFEPYSPAFNYRVIKGQTSDHALPAAEQFVRRAPSYQSEQLRSVLDETGTVIGYELRPLYLPFVYGTSDVLDIDYRSRGEKVIVTIRLKPFLEQQDGTDFRQGSKGNSAY